MTGTTQIMENCSERPKFEKSEKRDRHLHSARCRLSAHKLKRLEKN